MIDAFFRVIVLSIFFLVVVPPIMTKWDLEEKINTLYNEMIKTQQITREACSDEA